MERKNIPAPIKNNPMTDKVEAGVFSIISKDFFILLGNKANTSPSKINADARPKNTFSITRLRFPSCNQRTQSQGSLQLLYFDQSLIFRKHSVTL